MFLKPLYSTMLIVLCLVLPVSADWGALSSTKVDIHKFEFRKNQIILTVSIRGNGEYRMLLDTGVIPSVIDYGLAKELGLELDTTNAGNAAGRGDQTVQIIPTTIPQLAIDGQEFGDIRAVTSDLSRIGKPLGVELHGILGYSLLKDRILRIEYRNQTIEFFPDRQKLLSRMNGTVYLEKFTFENSDIMPTLRGMRLNGHKLIASVDTGSSLNVEVFDHRLGELELELPKNGDVSTIVGARGTAEVIDLLIDRITIGSANFSDQQITVAAIRNKDQVRMGNIGNAFLKNFTLSINYRDKELILEPEG